MTDTQHPQPSLTVVEWGAIDLSEDEPHLSGAIADARSIPAGVRRRLGLFEKSVVQAVLGLTLPDAPARIILGSRFGNLNSAANILDALARDEPPSPMLFSHSVLNAACGVANQVRKDRTSHTAIAAGRHTLHGALTEAWLQTGAHDGAATIAILADAPFPATYEALEAGWHGELCIGLRLERSSDAPPPETTALGSEGYHVLGDALTAGSRTLTFGNGHWSAAG